MIVNVKNVPESVRRWVVARYDENTKALWYYGSWDEKADAEKVVDELYNGLLVEVGE